MAVPSSISRKRSITVRSRLFERLSPPARTDICALLLPNVDDASNVDGFSIPIAISSNGDCPLANWSACLSILLFPSRRADSPLRSPYDLLPKCPDSLKKKDESGKVIGCNTDCGANPQNEEVSRPGDALLFQLSLTCTLAQYCCFGAHDTLATCPASGIPNHHFWLKACPISYVYAYGE